MVQLYGILSWLQTFKLQENASRVKEHKKHFFYTANNSKKLLFLMHNNNYYHDHNSWG